MATRTQLHCISLQRLQHFFVVPQDFVYDCLRVNFSLLRKFLDEFGNVLVKIDRKVEPNIRAIELAAHTF